MSIFIFCYRFIKYLLKKVRYRNKFKKTFLWREFRFCRNSFKKLSDKTSYRNIEELAAERGLKVDHSTVNRWVMEALQ